jgi:hypothetical protein
MPGLKSAAQAVLSCDVDVVESWTQVDFTKANSSLATAGAMTYGYIKNQLVTYGNTGQQSYGQLAGLAFGAGSLPTGNRGELVFTPTRLITQEERYQLTHVLNVIKPANTSITIGTPTVGATNPVTPRQLNADSELWLVQSRVTPATALIDPATPIYNNSGPYSVARPVFSDYSGETWNYSPTIVRSTSYRLDSTGQQSANSDEESVTYQDRSTHVYRAADGIRDLRQAMAVRLSAEGPVTAMPYAQARAKHNIYGNA